MDSKHNGKRVAERDRCETGEKLSMLRLVPIRSELIWRTDDDRVALESQRLRGL
jgi:hypothetical protein